MPTREYLKELQLPELVRKESNLETAPSQLGQTISSRHPRMTDEPKMLSTQEGHQHVVTQEEGDTGRDFQMAAVTKHSIDSKMMHKDDGVKTTLRHRADN